MLALRWGTSGVRWPITSRAADAAALALAAQDEPAARALAEALADDPTLTGWLLVAARRGDAPRLDTLAQLAAWSAKQPRAWIGVEAYEWPEVHRGAWEALRQAAVAAALDAAPSDGAVDSPAYQRALIRSLPPPGTLPAGMAAVDSERPAARGHLLPALASRLARLSDLEEQFGAALEAEKLAAMAELAAGAGHEINNPLGVIAGRAELLLRDEAHPERRQDLATIHAQAWRVRTLISDLMLFARPPELRLAEAELGELISRVVGEMLARALERGVELVATSPGAAPPIAVDAVQLEVALRAAIDNALEATGPGGRVSVDLEIGELAARITIADNGAGIPDAIRRHLYDPFYSGRQAGRGLGFGLAKAWRIVTLHGGKITVESSVGEGTKLVIELPRRG